MPSKSAASALKLFDPDMSVFVSANAGAGKTSLLTNRVLSLLLHGVEPAKILCLTFTNAAAAEMTSRILGELGKWVMADEAALRDTLEGVYGKVPDARLMARARSLFATVLEAPEGIRIQTIHGFCQSLLRRFPVEAGISPHFTVMDSRTEQEMLGEARLRLFNNAQASDPDLQSSIRYIAQTASEAAFHALLGEIIQHKRKFLTLFETPGGLPEVVDKLWAVVGVDRRDHANALMETYFSYDAKTQAGLKAIADMLCKGEGTDLKTGQALAAWLEEATPRSAQINAYELVFLTQEGAPRKTLYLKKSLTDPELIALMAAEQERVLRYAEARKSAALATQTSHLLTIAEALLAIYDYLKRTHATMDYDDLIFMASRLLAREGIAPWVLFKLDGGIDHILVDEAQDTSPEQWMIIDALTQDFFAGKGRSEAERSLFIVGDEKQSIYSFQGADVKALATMQRYFAGRISDALKQAHTMALTQSYRSTREVLSAVDAVFAQPHAKRGLMFEGGELTHVPTRLMHSGVVELWPLVTPGEQHGSPVGMLVRRIADTIAEWMAQGLARPGDIMILVRRRTALVDRLVRALKRKNIPVAGIDRMMLGDNLAIQDLVAFGQIMLLPEDDLTLAALLKSPICNMSEEQLFALAHGRKQSLWQRLQDFSFEEEIYADAFNLLSELRSKADYLSPFELYSRLLDTHGARRRFTGRMGEEYADPIDEFLNQALLYERSHTPSLQGFLHWLASSESEIKRDMEQTRGAVRIMTVHGAKGLQAPIVILPDTTEPPRQWDRLFWHEGLPLWPGSSKQDAQLTRVNRETQKDAMLAEYRRLLYVALTRAEDRLYICGATSREKANDESWYRLVETGLRAVAAEFDTGMGMGLRLGEAPKAAINTKEDVKITLPKKDFSFLFERPPVEPIPPKPLTPSKLAGADPAVTSPLSAIDTYQRGKLVHRLLQYLPEAKDRLMTAKRIAAGFAGVPEEMRAECIAEVSAILDDPRYAFLFAEGTLTEVPIAGNVTAQGKIIAVSGQIDRLAVHEKEVWIVDYKSNANPPEDVRRVPPAYLRQMLLYKLLLARIYPDRNIRCALLWTAQSALMPLDNALLDETTLNTYI